MKKVITTCSIVALLSFASVSAALASPLGAFRPNFFRDIPSTTSTIEEGHAQLAPMPFVVFCMQYASDCNTEGTQTSVELTPEKFAELNEVNARVNGAIRPQEDTSAMRLWKLDVDAGDCNEYAVQKRHELIKAGWPAAALSLTVAKTAWGEGHLLVTVRTDHGDLVLDSLRREIVPWDQAHYHWIMRQSAADVRTWVAIDAPAGRPRHHWRHHELHFDRPVPAETAMTMLTPLGPEPTTGLMIHL
jgi:predicted transglutaminase-like cysteine proteinase